MKRFILLIVVIISLILIVTSCSEDKPADPKRTVATPTFDPPGGTYYSAQNVTISCETEGAVIKYTTDGREPTDDSIDYVSPIQISDNTTLIAKAFKDGWDASQIATTQYTIEDLPPETVATLTFDPPGGNYDTPKNVTIRCATDGVTIRYTKDGSEPTENSDVYTSPVQILTTTTLKARGFKSGWNPSSIVSVEYTIDEVTPGEMVFVQGGTFSPEANYTVNLSSFYIGRYEVTKSEWTSVMGDWNSDPYGWGSAGIGENNPIYYVSWFDAIEYCNRLSIREGLNPCYSYLDYGTNPNNWPAGWNEDRDNHTNVSCNWEANGYRLPTEMEYEFAARGGLPAQTVGTFNDRWAGTDVEAELGDYAWYEGNTGGWPDGTTHTVGTKLPNELDLYDMSGNVWNWVWDIWGNYPTGVHNDPTGPTSGAYRVFRCGSWGSNAAGCTVSYRVYYNATHRNFSIGFRVCRVIP